MPDSSPGPLAAADAGLMPQKIPPIPRGSATAIVIAIEALSEFLRSLPVIVIAIEALKRLLATVRDRYTELTVAIVGIELEALK